MPKEKNILTHAEMSSKGGKAAAAKMTAEERSERARKAGSSPKSKRSLKLSTQE